MLCMVCMKHAECSRSHFLKSLMPGPGQLPVCAILIPKLYSRTSVFLGEKHICPEFLRGKCTKGFRCEFSHS